MANDRIIKSEMFLLTNQNLGSFALLKMTEAAFKMMEAPPSSF